MPNRPPDPPYDPRFDPRQDPRFDPRQDPRFDPRQDPRFDDPRFEPGGQRFRDEERRPPPGGRRPRNLWLWITAGLIGLILVALFAVRLTQAGPGEDRLADDANSNAGAPEEGAEARCGSQATYDLVKGELFRRAAEVRGSDQAAFDRLAAYAVLRVDSPVLKNEDEALGTLVCSGRLALDLPPGVGVVGGRRTLTSAADYSLQPAADGSGAVATLAGADGIIVPLATLARTGTQPGLPTGGVVPPTDGTEPDLPTDATGAPPVPLPPPTASAPPAPVEPAAPPATAARPSFDCADARTRGEVAVCRNPQLAGLDRRMSGEFFGALREATPAQRTLLQRTRTRFLTYRDRCGSDACIAGAYNDRITEIRDIMAGRWRTPG